MTTPTPGHTTRGTARMETVRAVVQTEWGTDPDEVLKVAEVSKPTVRDDDVLVRVAAASVDMGTWHCMTGLPYAMRLAGFGIRSPKAANPGRSFAGTVEAVGKDVTGFALGDEVFGTCEGSFAEVVRVDVDKVAPKPVCLTFEHAASVPISGVTAFQAVCKAEVKPTDRVLVLGASGGVGTFAVQMAKAIGAHVTGVCSTAKMDLVSSLGADHVIDYTRNDATDGKQQYDVILDIGGSRRLSHLRRSLTSDGDLVIVGGETGGRWIGGFDRSLRAVLLSTFVGQRLGMLASKENAEDLRSVAALIESGQVTPAVDSSYPLTETANAIRHVSEGRARGKVVIVI